MCIEKAKQHKTVTTDKNSAAQWIKTGCSPVSDETETVEVSLETVRR